MYNEQILNNMNMTEQLTVQQPMVPILQHGRAPAETFDSESEINAHIGASNENITVQKTGQEGQFVNMGSTQL